MFATGLFCLRQHQFDAVQLIDLTGAWAIIHGGNIGIGIAFFKRFDDSLADHVIRKARKGLNTYDIGYAGGKELDHFACEKPAFAVLITE